MMDRMPLMEFEELDPGVLGIPFLPCAFTPKRRHELFDWAVQVGFGLSSALVDPHAVTAASSRIGGGSFVNAMAVIGGASILGECVVVNRAANIGHHCVLSDFVSLGPGATLAGNVGVGEMATIGAGAVVLPDVKIGSGAIVSAGAVVRRDVRAGTVVAGNPAHQMRMRPSDTQLWQTVQE